VLCQTAVRIRIKKTQKIFGRIQRKTMNG